MLFQGQQNMFVLSCIVRLFCVVARALVGRFYDFIG